MPKPPVNFAPSFVDDLPGAARLDDAADLLARFGIEPSHERVEQLQDAAAMYRVFAGRRQPTQQERRARLRRIEAEARALVRARGDRDGGRLAILLLRSGDGLAAFAQRFEHCVTRDADTDEAAKSILPIAFEPGELAGILAEVRGALRRLRPRRHGRGGDAGLRIFMREVAAIWEGGTGRRASVTNDPITSKRRGRFLDFAGELAGRLGIVVTADALAGVHLRWKKYTCISCLRPPRSG
jgi:hypothetical protein